MANTAEIKSRINSVQQARMTAMDSANHNADAAKEALLQKRSIQEYRSAQATLARALNRLRVKRGEEM